MLDQVSVVYATEELIPSFRDCLDTVARERVYIETIEAPPLERMLGFHGGLMRRNGPIYFAVDGRRVVGWCDIFPLENPRHSHRGSLGMGLIPEVRGKGVGSRLLEATLLKAKEFGLEKVELSVYTSNLGAIALYKKFGFEEEGLIQKYRKLDGRYFDCVVMGKFLT